VVQHLVADPPSLRRLEAVDHPIRPHTAEFAEAEGPHSLHSLVRIAAHIRLVLEGRHSSHQRPHNLCPPKSSDPRIAVAAILVVVHQGEAPRKVGPRTCLGSALEQGDWRQVPSTGHC